MSPPVIKGWCPGALRPMESGDGWLVRVRPHGGRLTATQAKGLAEASVRHGNGVIDLSSRANIQLRGVRTATHPALVDDLRRLGLVDDTVQAEAARNIMIAPFWSDDDEQQAIADALALALAGKDAPVLPGKFGFAVDAGVGASLRQSPADIRIEAHPAGLMVRADGRNTGAVVTTAQKAVDTALDLARWFIAVGGVTNSRGRMVNLLAPLPAPFLVARMELSCSPLPTPGAYPAGWLVALGFGQMSAETLAGLGAVRLTPWRMLLIEGAQVAPNLPGVITMPDDPLLRVSACTGAPGCPQALGDTRGLARELAMRVPKGRHVHVSGCAKGCAHPRAADLTVVAMEVGYGLIRDGIASDTPERTGLSSAMITAEIAKAPNAPSL